MSAMEGSTELHLLGPEYPNWATGDLIVIASSSYEPSEAEIKTIAVNNESSGVIILTEPLDFDHIILNILSTNQAEEAGMNESLQLSPEVGLLTHNIVIQGGNLHDESLEEQEYGCRILIGQFQSFSGVTYAGSMQMDSVEIRYCGQGGYFSPYDPRYSIAFHNCFEASSGSYVRHCAIHHGYNTAIGVHTSQGVEVNHNVVYRTTGSSMKIGGRDNSVMDNLALGTLAIQSHHPNDNHAVDFPATYDVDVGNTLTGNAAAGSDRISFRYAGELCYEGRKAKFGEEVYIRGISTYIHAVIPRLSVSLLTHVKSNTLYVPLGLKVEYPYTEFVYER